jgi:ATP-dependent RNA helicase RhlB
MKFTELSLHPDLQRGIDEAGFIDCMPVQEMVFAHSLKGEDIYAQSQTGTGKTAAFLISIFQRMMSDSELRTKKALILAPTRELAVQIKTEAEKIGLYLGIKTGAFYGGVSYGPQFDMLRSGVQIIVGTPGRIIDLLTQGKMILKDVGFLVIDEADRMFDMGFVDDIRRLLRYLPAADKRQTFLFSATLGLRVKDLAWEYMKNPREIAIEPEKVTAEMVTQELYHVGSHEKLSLLLGLLKREQPKSCLIFCNQKFMVEELARRLRVNGVHCEFIMGDLPQSRRLEVIQKLKSGSISTLVATDVAARGLDIEALDLVVNYDVPEDAESYVHRIGRTARAGKAGKAITLACEKFVFGLHAIEKFLGTKIPVMKITDELFQEDRSAGIHFSRERGGEGRGRAGGRQKRSGSSSHGAGSRRSQRTPGGRRTPAPRPKATPKQAQREQNNVAKERIDPYALTQDERMQGYKKRYGGGKKQPQGSYPHRPPARGQDSRQAVRHAMSKKTEKSVVEAPPKGLFARIKELFKGKK